MESEKVDTVCPICNSGEHVEFGIHSDGDRLFAINRCMDGCGCLYVVYPEGWDIHSIYDGAKYHVDRQKYTKHVLYKDRFDHDYKISIGRLKFVKEYIQKLNLKHESESRLIDVGCSNGALVKAALDNGYKNVYGCDISEYIIDKAKEATGFGDKLFVHNVDSELFSKEHKKKYDIVQCNDVVEHSDNPVRFLVRLRSLLSRGGVMFVDTPDFGDPEFMEVGLSYRHVKPIEHTVMLSEDVLIYMAGRADLEVCDFYKPIPGKIVMVATYKR